MTVEMFCDFFLTIKGLREGLKRNINKNHANKKNAPQSCVIAMESFEACSGMLSTQKVSTNDKQEAKRKIASDVKEVETQHKISETNFAAPPRPSILLKHSANSGLETDLANLSSYSSVVKMKII